jgi:cytidylate kinase
VVGDGRVRYAGRDGELKEMRKGAVVMGAFDDVITVDGASGAGKSTLLTALGRSYSALAIEFGPIVRTVAWWASHNKATIADAVALIARLDALGQVSIAELSSSPLAASEVALRGMPMRQRIFSAALAEATAATADDAAATAWIAGLVRARIHRKRAALSGRQAATLVCPQAGLRIRLEASPLVRSQRKVRQLTEAGMRARWADDARLLPSSPTDVIMDTTYMTIAELEQTVFGLVESRLGWRPIGSSAVNTESSLGGPAGILLGAASRPT